MRTGEFKLRPATTGDSARIHEVERASFPSPWSLESFLDLILRKDVEVWVAEGSLGRVEAYTVWWTVFGEAEVANLAVHPDHRGSGLGGRLLDSALSQMETNGAHTAFLEVRASNDPARRLYASRGFEVIAVRPGYYRKPVEDALIMSRSLGQGGIGD